MSNLIAVISSEFITEEALLAFVLQKGGYTSNYVKGGHLSEGKAHIQILLDDGVLPCIQGENADANPRSPDTYGFH